MFYWDPNPDAIIIPILNWPIKWYGLFFALGFAVGIPIFQNILYRFFILNKKNDHNDLALKKQAAHLTDKMILYIVIATVVGARLGHYIFYEKISEFFHDPIEIFRVWNGGLASHGAAIAIIVAICFFSRYAKKIHSGLTPIRILDFVCVPTALAGAFIRIGNFFNQEILGTKTILPWGVVFGHPLDGSYPMPRHPVQLYEAGFYLIVFLLLWHLTYRKFFLNHQGRLIGLFLILVFGFRFVIEFFKLEQSRIFSSHHVLTMGQWLSVPLVIGGVLLILFSCSFRFFKKT